MNKSDIGIIIQIITGLLTISLVIFGVKNKNIILLTSSLIPLAVFSLYWFLGIRREISKLNECVKRLTIDFNNQKNMINIRERLTKIETIIEERKNARKIESF